MPNYSITSQSPQYFLEKRKLIDPYVEDGGPECIYRYIEHQGWLVSQFFDVVTIINSMGREEVLHNCLCFGNDRHRCMRMKNKLNSEIVRSQEPMLWNSSPSWQRAYNDTHHTPSTKSSKTS